MTNVGNMNNVTNQLFYDEEWRPWQKALKKLSVFVYTVWRTTSNDGRIDYYVIVKYQTPENLIASTLPLVGIPGWTEMQSFQDLCAARATIIAQADAGKDKCIIEIL